MLCYDWLVFNSCDWRISSLAVSVAWVISSVVRCCMALLLLCFLIVGIHANTHTLCVRLGSGVKIRLFLLELITCH